MRHDKVVAKIVYEEALAAVKAQHENLETYRSRALVGLTAAGTFASLLSLDDAPRSWPFWLALAAASVGVVCVGVVLWPRDWKVNPANTGWSTFVDNPLHDESTTHAQLAIWHQQNIDDNDRSVETVWRAYVWSIVVFAVAIGALTLNAVQPVDDSPEDPLRVIVIED